MKNFYLLLALLLLPAIAGAQAPANDNFANRQTISTGLTTTNIANATVQAGEIDTTTGKTVWYSYTPTVDSIITLDTTGTAFNFQFVTAYIGTDLNNLIYIDSGESDHSSSPFSFSFKAKAGSTYQICAGRNVSGNDSSGTTVNLTLFTTPFSHTGPLYSNETSEDGFIKNDRFEDRTSISGSSLTVISYMNDSSSQAGEPDTSNGKTGWYTYQATADSIVSIDTTGTEFSYHFVSVYMGSSINNLIKITSGSTTYSSSPFTRTFKAKAGTTYQICVGRDSSSMSVGATLLQFTLTTTPFTYVGTLYGPAVPTAPTPRNDSFYSPQAITGNLLTVIGSTASATTEPGEGDSDGSVWYSWSTPTDKLVRINFIEPSYGIFIVFTGATLQTAVQLPPLEPRTDYTYSFMARAGINYKFVTANTYGPFQFSLTASSPPVNDAPVSKITSPRKGQTVSSNGFSIQGNVKDKNGISAFQVRINGKTILNKAFPYSGTIKSGKVKKGKVTVQMRAKDTLGKWGPYHTVKVTAK